MDTGIQNDYVIRILNNQIQWDSNIEGIIVKDTSITFLENSPKQIRIEIEIGNETHVEYQFSKRSHLELIETRTSLQNGSLNRKIVVEQDANVAMLVLDETKHDVKCHDEVETYENANLESAYAELSLSQVSGKFDYYLKGEGANVNVKVGALASNDYKKHYEISLFHQAPLTYGQMDNYGVTKDHSELVFDGVGKIDKGMSQSSSHQTSKIIVFDPTCKAKANPYLYIDEYDVKASHAAGVGKMDEDHLFYLESRGLSKNAAMKLITYGYLMPVVNVISNPTLKEAFEALLEKRMGDE